MSSSIGAVESELPAGANGIELEVREVLSPSGGVSSASPEAEQAHAVEALIAEISQLRELLRDRTAAWRDALRQLSDVQTEVASLAGPSAVPHHIESMSELDWERIQKP